MTETGASQKAGDTIVVEGLTKHYGEVQALRGIDFSVRAGEIVGFLGPNGAGKTTTMKILTCFMAATEGAARVAGFDVDAQSEEVRRKIGYLPENVPLYDAMLVYDYLWFVAEIQEVPRKRRHDRIGAVAELTGIEAVMGRAIRELSKGFRQRVGLAQAIIHEPEVIILDEPTTGLDPNQIVEIRDVITTIGREKTIIFSTHILQEVTAVCDRIIIIDEGELVADGRLEELEQKVTEAAPGLLVGFQSDDEEGLRQYLEGLDGVGTVQAMPARRQTLHFRVQSDDDDDGIRQAIIEGEARSPRGLVSLRAAEPTLEEIFRLFTTEKSQRSGKDSSGQDASPRTEDGASIAREVTEKGDASTVAVADEVAHE